MKIILSLLLFLTLSCAPLSLSYSSLPAQTLLITIENHAFEDASVSVEWNGIKRRLGEVVGKTTKTFETQFRHEQLRIIAHLIASETIISETLYVSPGEHIDFVIMPTR